jgi:hypothetical protein
MSHHWGILLRRCVAQARLQNKSTQTPWPQRTLNGSERRAKSGCEARRTAEVRVGTRPADKLNAVWRRELEVVGAIVGNLRDVGVTSLDI